MKRLCPTIQSLLAFDAVAHHESLTLAAEALCLSISAVSKQIAGLEVFVGRPLLAKSGRGVRLTATGREYWTKISIGLRLIETATIEAQDDGSTSGVLVLACVPTFLTKWLIPRLTDFRRRFPTVTFVFRQHVGLQTPFPSDVDAAISHGLGYWPNVASQYIVGREYVCICSPVLAARGRPIRRPGDLLGHTLLHLEDAPLAWRTWAIHHRLDQRKMRLGPCFAQYSAVIQAVLSGLGVGLVPRILVENQLRTDRLMGFFEFCNDDQGHYLCSRTDLPERPVLNAFRAWLLEQEAIRLRAL